MAQDNGVFSIGVVNVVGSLIARYTDCGVYLQCGREVAVPATKSFTAQIVALLMVAIWVSYQKGKDHRKTTRAQIVKELRQLPTNIGTCLDMIDESVNRIAKKLSTIRDIFLLGKGAASAIAKEGALKMKECTYLRCEAFCAGEMKHGPLALIDESKPKSSACILFIFRDENFHDMLTTLSEMNSRNAMTIIVTDCYEDLPKEKVDDHIDIIDAGILTPLLGILPIQKLTLEICNILGLNCDQPRNLAKTVTVK